MFQHLLSPVELLGLRLDSRVVMAPMTRARAPADGVPSALMAEYYAQRASAGLIISEAINVSIDAIGSPLTPGLFTPDQVRGWHSVTSAVHAEGGHIVAQLWHTGRVGHSQVRGGRLPVAPSAVAITGQQHFTGTGMLDYETPRALTLDEVRSTVDDFAEAARNARLANFDGIELHAAFGYLPHQFLSDGANGRTDAYGGSIENRCRFVLEVMAALANVWPAARVGIKLSPTIPFNGMVDSDPRALYSHLIEGLNELSPGYIHLMNPMFPLDAFPHWPRDVLGTFGPMTRSPLISNGGYDAERADDAIRQGRAQLVSFGNLFIANPDLPRRLAAGAPLATADRDTMYGGGQHGYTDYPSMVG